MSVQSKAMPWYRPEATNPPGTFLPRGSNLNNQLTFTINNWVKYNPNKDQKTYTWLRLDNNIAVDPKLYELSAAQKFIWVLILCEASKQNDGSVTFSIDWLCHISGADQQQVTDTIDFLVSNKMITETHERDHDRARSQPRTCDIVGTSSTYVRKYVRKEVRKKERNAQPDGRAIDSNLDTETKTQNKENQEALGKSCTRFDFESLYRNFPRKQGKKKGILACKRQIKTEEAYSKLMAAVTHYSNYCVAQELAQKYIKHFSTFMTEWEDWVEPESNKSNQSPAPKIKPLTQEDQAKMDILDKKLKSMISEGTDSPC